MYIYFILPEGMLTRIGQSRQAHNNQYFLDRTKGSMCSVGKIHPAHFQPSQYEKIGDIDIYPQRQPMATSSFNTKRGELEVVSWPLQSTGLPQTSLFVCSTITPWVPFELIGRAFTRTYFSFCWKSNDLQRSCTKHYKLHYSTEKIDFFFNF